MSWLFSLLFMMKLLNMVVSHYLVRKMNCEISIDVIKKTRKMKRTEKKEEQYQVLRPDELPSSADITGVGGIFVRLYRLYVFSPVVVFPTLNMKITQEYLQQFRRIILPSSGIFTTNLNKRIFKICVWLPVTKTVESR